MEKELPVRKKIRLEGYDYSRNGAYYVTFCVEDRHELLGQIDVGSGFHARPQPDVALSELGKEVQKTLEYISSNENRAQIHKYIIMPNHVHMIIYLTALGHGGNAVRHGSLTLQSVVGRIKSYTAKRWSDMCSEKYQTFWQPRFHDRIIRDDDEYRRIWQYIDENPARWADDEYYNK